MSRVVSPSQLSIVVSRTDVSDIDLGVAKPMPIAVKLTSNSDKARIITSKDSEIEWKAEADIFVRYQVVLGGANSLLLAASASLACLLFAFASF